jgi:uncharacterized protein YjbI with pentapeptide repeats
VAKELDGGEQDATTRPRDTRESIEELAQILEDHKAWLQTVGADGKRADFSERLLREVDLKGVCLREALFRKTDLRMVDMTQAELDKADFWEASLEGCTLSQANLRSANLESAKILSVDESKADVSGADLTAANLAHAILDGSNLSRAFLDHANFTGASVKGADLKDASLYGAILTDANLEGVSGLIDGQLAGSNLCRAKLPEDIARFSGVDQVAEISKQAKTLFLAVIGACVFCWLTIGMTRDAQLVLNNATSPLPVIQTKVPIASFYLIAPVVLLALYVYFHLYLQDLWSALSKLPAFFPDGRSVIERVYPWLMTGLGWSHVAGLKSSRPPFFRLRSFISFVTGWLLVPFTIFLFWGHYVRLHEPAGSVWHLVLLALALWFAVDFYRSAVKTLRGMDSRGWKVFALFPGWMRFPRGASLLGLAVVCACAAITTEAILGEPQWRGIPYGTGLSVRLSHEELSEKGPDWQRLSGTADARLRTVKGANLKGKDLRGALANNSFLARADLFRTKLQGADLLGADLRRANLAFANLQRANLAWANLQGADLAFTNLQRAFLFTANLKGAKLQEANLSGANLQRADLRDVKTITQSQLDEACGDEETKLPPGLTMRKCPKPEEKPKEKEKAHEDQTSP